MFYYKSHKLYFLCYFATLVHISLGAAITSLIRIMSSETGTLKSSLGLSSLLECQSWAHSASEPLDAISYDPDSGACAINELPPFSVYKAISQPEQGSHAYYMDVGCIPSYCPDLDTFKTNTTAYPADLIYFAPLAAESGSSLDVDAYFTSSLTKAAEGVSAQLWDEPFLDGNFPLWQSDSIQQGQVTLAPAKTFGTISVFAWAYFKSSVHTANRPVLSFHGSGRFDSGFCLTGGGTTSYVDKLTFWITDHISGPHSIISDEAIIKEDVWQHLGVTYDATTGESHLYYNGKVVKSANLGAGIQTHTVQVGLYNVGLSLDGIVDISANKACEGCASLYHETYERALTAAEVDTIYNRVFCRFPADYCNFY